MTREEKREYDRAWRNKNRDRVRAAQKRYKEADPERTRQQRKETFSRYYAKNRDVLCERARMYGRRRPKEQVMLTGAKVRAKQQGLPFDITIADIVIPEVCPVLGIPIQSGEGKLSPNSPSLDKIAPEKGYVKGNICVISHRANSIKSNGTIEEHEAVIKYMKKHLDKARQS